MPQKKKNKYNPSCFSHSNSFLEETGNVVKATHIKVWGGKVTKIWLVVGGVFVFVLFF